GTIDVVVNNAGYGLISSPESIIDSDVRKNFDVNVFAAINVVKNILPLMRKQRSGYIFNMGSVAGFAGAPGWSVYSAAKAAIAAFSEVLAADVKEFNVKVTVVEPSAFKTGFLSSDSLIDLGAEAGEYTAVANARDRYLAGNGSQPGDPEKAAEILIGLSELEIPPLHLYLGKDAYQRASAKLSTMTSEIEAWKKTSLSADF
ncbi:MAG: SDR family NAD(P)-dependent oxidoreductase, partial [Chitinophagaceae bacterium]